jgi:hypothetical protein
MIFATGGYAEAILEGSYCVPGAGGLSCGFPTTVFNGETKNNGWYVGGGFEFVAHQGPLADLILGVEYQHWEVDSKVATCFTPTCTTVGVNAVGDYRLGGSGDLVRARLTFKSHGFPFWRR